jgi:hypothetical protein
LAIIEQRNNVALFAARVIEATHDWHQAVAKVIVE